MQNTMQGYCVLKYVKPEYKDGQFIPGKTVDVPVHININAFKIFSDTLGDGVEFGDLQENVDLAKLDILVSLVYCSHVAAMREMGHKEIINKEQMYDLFGQMEEDSDQAKELAKAVDSARINGKPLGAVIGDAKKKMAQATKDQEEG